MPKGHRGVVVDKKDAPKAQAPRPGEPRVVDVDAEEEMPLGALEAVAEFDEMIVWGHESMAEASADPYVRGVDEWMKLSEQVLLRELHKKLHHADVCVLLDTFV